MNHDAFTTLLLLGTGRLKTPPPAPFPVLEAAWAALDWSRAEAAALSGCALRAAATGAGFAARAGFSLEEPCAEESRPAAPAAAGAVLRRILGGEAPECLPEWLERCAAGGFLAAPRDLPALLETARRDQETRPALSAVLGARGAWLARREGMAPLFPAAETGTDDAWETGSLTERLAWLRAARRMDPARAASALAAVWPGESAENRIAFLTVIGGAPTDDELPFLENTALRDRRREVRALVRGALLSRPAGAFVSRAFARAVPLLRMEGMLLMKRLVLDLPAAFDPAWKDDGLEEKLPAGAKGLGPRAHWAVQLLGCVPLSRLAAHFQMEPAKLLTLNKDPDSARRILLGWLEAALAHPEPDSAEALARHLAGLEKWPGEFPPAVPALVRLLGALPEDTAARLVEAAEAGVLASAAPGQLFSATRFPVPPAAAARWLTAVLAGLRAKPYPVFQAPAARRLALRFPVSFLPEALRRLAAEESLSSAAEAFGRVLEFRLQLHEAFPPATRDRTSA